MTSTAPAASGKRCKVVLDGLARLFDAEAEGGLGEFVTAVAARFALSEADVDLVWTDEDGDRVLIDDENTFYLWLASPKPRASVENAHLRKRANKPVAELYAAGASSLAASGIIMPAGELKALVKTMRIPPRRLAAVGLVPPSLLPEGADDEQVTDGSSGDDGDGEGRVGANNTNIFKVLRNRGVATATREAMVGTLGVLKVPPKRFVKLGLLPRTALQAARNDYARCGGKGGAGKNWLAALFRGGGGPPHMHGHHHPPPPHMHGHHHPPPPHMHGHHHPPPHMHQHGQHGGHGRHRGGPHRGGGGGQRQRLAVAVSGNGPDDHVVAGPAGGTVTKTWQVRNMTAHRPWPEPTRLLLLDGAATAKWPAAFALPPGTGTTQSVRPVLTTLSVQLPVPTTPGDEESATYQLAGPRGGRFGEPLKVSVLALVDGAPSCEKVASAFKEEDFNYEALEDSDLKRAKDRSLTDLVGDAPSAEAVAEAARLAQAMVMSAATADAAALAGVAADAAAVEEIDAVADAMAAASAAADAWETIDDEETDSSLF